MAINDLMKEELILQLLYTFFSIVVIFTVEEIICFVIIKKRGELENFKEYKAKQKKPYFHSQYLYQNKKYLFAIKFILIVFVLLRAFVFDANYLDSKTYYDVNGYIYNNFNDILFYDEAGDCYSIDKETGYFIDSDNNLTDKCYVDVSGNVADTGQSALYISSIPGVSYNLNGEIYFTNTYIYWDKDSRMHYMNRRKDIIVDDYTFAVDIKTGDCFIKEK